MPSANSSIFDIGIVGDVSARIMIDESAGLTLRNDGGVGMSGGSCRAAVAMAVCTSCAAASMLRSSENCSVICAVPSALVEVIESSDAMVENCFSSGVATAVAIVSGLAPGNDALTEMVGKSTAGKSETGNDRYASVPKNASPNVSSAVPTGRRTNGSEMFTRGRPPGAYRLFVYQAGKSKCARSGSSATDRRPPPSHRAVHR